MIESLINPENVQKKPWEAFIAGFLFTMAACILTLQLGITGSGAGFLVVAFISIAAAPFMVRIFHIEEKKKKGNIFDRHDEVIQVFAFFFLSVIIASSLFFVIMGPEAGGLFHNQVLDLCSKGITWDPVCTVACETGSLGGYVCTQGATITGHAVSFEPSMVAILVNNLEILLLAFIFSLMLGAGAVWLISWNATVIGILVAKIAENPIAYGSMEIVKGNVFLNYLVALPFTLLMLLPHGIFEFGGYFFGAVAGGILSVAIVRNKFKTFTTMEQSVKDSFIYLIIAVILIVIGAVVEVVV